MTAGSSHQGEKKPQSVGMADGRLPRENISQHAPGDSERKTSMRDQRMESETPPGINVDKRKTIYHAPRSLENPSCNLETKTRRRGNAERSNAERGNAEKASKVYPEPGFLEGLTEVKKQVEDFHCDMSKGFSHASEKSSPNGLLDMIIAGAESGQTTPVQLQLQEKPSLLLPYRGSPRSQRTDSTPKTSKRTPKESHLTQKVSQQNDKNPILQQSEGRSIHQPCPQSQRNSGTDEGTQEQETQDRSHANSYPSAIDSEAEDGPSHISTDQLGILHDYTVKCSGGSRNYQTKKGPPPQDNGSEDPAGTDRNSSQCASNSPAAQTSSILEEPKTLSAIKENRTSPHCLSQPERGETRDTAHQASHCDPSTNTGSEETSDTARQAAHCHPSTNTGSEGETRDTAQQASHCHPSTNTGSEETRDTARQASHCHPSTNTGSEGETRDTAQQASQSSSDSLPLEPDYQEQDSSSELSQQADSTPRSTDSTVGCLESEESSSGQPGSMDSREGLHESEPCAVKKMTQKSSSQLSGDAALEPVPQSPRQPDTRLFPQGGCIGERLQMAVTADQIPPQVPTVLHQTPPFEQWQEASPQETQDRSHANSYPSAIDIEAEDGPSHSTDQLGIPNEYTVKCSGGSRIYKTKKGPPPQDNGSEDPAGTDRNSSLCASNSPAAQTSSILEEPKALSAIKENRTSPHCLSQPERGETSDTARQASHCHPSTNTGTDQVLSALESVSPNFPQPSSDSLPLEPDYQEQDSSSELSQQADITPRSTDSTVGCLESEESSSGQPGSMDSREGLHESEPCAVEKMTKQSSSQLSGDAALEPVPQSPRQQDAMLLPQGECIGERLQMAVTADQIPPQVPTVLHQAPPFEQMQETSPQVPTVHHQTPPFEQWQEASPQVPTVLHQTAPFEQRQVEASPQVPLSHHSQATQPAGHSPQSSISQSGQEVIDNILLGPIPPGHYRSSPPEHPRQQPHQPRGASGLSIHSTQGHVQLAERHSPERAPQLLFDCIRLRRPRHTPLPHGDHRMPLAAFTVDLSLGAVDMPDTQDLPPDTEGDINLHRRDLHTRILGASGLTHRLQESDRESTRLPSNLQHILEDDLMRQLMAFLRETRGEHDMPALCVVCETRAVEVFVLPCCHCVLCRVCILTRANCPLHTCNHCIHFYWQFRR
ncbi:hypothetical protein ACOMHN_031039 [Nucella lapillus]